MSGREGTGDSTSPPRSHTLTTRYWTEFPASHEQIQDSSQVTENEKKNEWLDICKTYVTMFILIAIYFHAIFW